MYNYLAYNFGKFMREKGNEFGSTTGRPRRCGWFDGVAVKQAVMLNGVTEMAIMKMDILDGLKEIKVCTAYKYKGKLIREFPHDFQALSNLKPVYETMPGWKKVSAKPKSFRDLQPNAKAYLSKLSDILKTKISMISVGSAREDTIFLD